MTPSLKPLIPPTPYRRHTAVGGRSGERGQEAYAHKGLPCKDGYIRDVDDVRKKVPEKKDVKIFTKYVKTLYK